MTWWSCDEFTGSRKYCVMCSVASSGSRLELGMPDTLFTTGWQGQCSTPYTCSIHQPACNMLNCLALLSAKYWRCSKVGTCLWLFNYLYFTVVVPSAPSPSCIGVNHEIAFMAEVVMKTRQYLQTNCHGALQCTDVSTWAAKKIYYRNWHDFTLSPYL